MRSLESLRREERVEPIFCAGIADLGINRVDGLILMMEAVGRVGLIIEVGSYRGVSTEVLLHFCGRLVAVDHWLGFERAKREFDARFSTQPNVSCLRMPSLEAARLVADRVADLVYIDAGHDERSVAADIVAWAPKVKPGGWLAGHDYSMEVSAGGVIAAVDKAFKKPHRVFPDASWLVRI